jgi:rsbT antagonist protein RsbS
MKVPILQQGPTLLTSFQDDLTDRDVLGLQADLMERINHTGANSVLMDVSAMDTIDSYQAKMLRDTARIARILGCSVVLSGIQPRVAISLIELGEVIAGMRHALNVEEGIAMLREQEREDGDP